MERSEPSRTGKSTSDRRALSFTIERSSRGARRATTVVAGLLAVGLVAASCGGTASPSAAPGASSTAAGTSAAASGPVTIGLLAPMTGSRSDLGSGMQLGAQLALGAINAGGGVLGHQVKLVTQDDAADPADAAPAAQLEINSDHVVAIIGPTAITDSVVLPLVDKANIPNLMFGGGSEFDAATDPHFFRMSPSDTEQAQAMVYYAHSKGWSSIALAFGASSGSQALVPGIKDAAKALGMTVTGNVTFTAGASSYRSEIQKLFAGKPQVIIAQFNNATAGVVFGEIAQAGLNSTPWIGSNLWYTDTWFKSVGPTIASGPIYLANSSSSGMLGAKAFLDLLQKKTGSNIPKNGEEFMYDAAMTWALGAQVAGTWSWPKIRDGILKASDPPGTACGDWSSCAALIKKGTKIDWQGSASTVDFNKYDNVFGPFAILRYDSSGNAKTVVTLTPQKLETAFNK